MNGGMTIYDLDELRAKAQRLDAALKYLEGRGHDSEQTQMVERILRGCEKQASA